MTMSRKLHDSLLARDATAARFATRFAVNVAAGVALSVAARFAVSVALSVAATVALTAGAAAAAGEQRDAKGGEQRYEVTIAPPHRPGAPMPEPPESDEEGSGAEQDQQESAPPDAAAPENGATTPPASDAKSGAVTASATAKTATPRMALQVGAYRQKSSAEKLRATLSESFKDVTIVETMSGGEPLYRVRVGRIPKGPALEDTRRRLLAAGYSAFEVPATDPQAR